MFQQQLTITTPPPPAVPEVPTVVLVSLSLLAAAGIWFGLSRRRRTVRLAS